MTNKYDIASAMSSIMASPRHQATFAKPQPQFQKTAAKKEDDKEDVDPVKDCVDYCKKVMKEADCGGSAKASGDKCVISCPDSKIVSKCKAYCKKKDVECEVKEPKGSEKPEKSKKAKAYEACVIGLAKISEILDNAGLAKESAYTLMALDGLVRNAAAKSKSGTSDCGMAKDKAEKKEKAEKDDKKDKSEKDKSEKDKSEKDKSEKKGKKGKKDEADCGVKMKPKKAQYNFELEPADVIHAKPPQSPSPAPAQDKQQADDNDVFSFRASKDDEEFPWETAEGLEDIEPIDFSEFGSELDEDLREKMDEVDESSHLDEMIAEELEGFEPPKTGTEALANKKLNSLMRVAFELNNTLRSEAAAKVKARNKGAPIFDSTHAKVKDNKDHFPIDTIGRARNALARVNQFDSAPEWWSGSLKELQNAVVRAVHGKYPSIEISDKAKKPGKG